MPVKSTRYIREFKPANKRIGDGEWSIEVQRKHKGLRDIKLYRKEELYQMMGDAQTHINKLEDDNSILYNELQNKDETWLAEEQDWNIRNELLDDRIGVRSRQLKIWRWSFAIATILCLVMVWLLFTSLAM